MAEIILRSKILDMRLALEHLISDRMDLQDDEVIKCSQSLDKLIDQYQILTGSVIGRFESI